MLFRSKTTRSDFAGINNPNYILYTDYYGDVYAKYVGPYDGSIAYSIWVLKTDPLKDGYLKPSNDLLQDFASSGSKWIVDSGCTNHMTGTRRL